MLARVPHEASRTLAGVAVVRSRLHPVDHRGDVARRRLQVALTARGKIGVHHGAAHGQVFEIDHVDVGPPADLDQSLAYLIQDVD